MKTVFESISNRELAFLIWMCLVFVLVIFKSTVRKAAGNILNIIFCSKLTFYFLWVAFYTAGIVYLLWQMDLWNVTQLKNTLLWFFTAGAASLFHITDKKKSNYLRETIKDVLSITAILQFVAGLYSFSLAAELVLVPLTFIIFGMTVIAERSPEHQSAKQLLRSLIVYGGLLLICYTLFKIITDFESFASKGTLNDFLIPAVLSFLFLPMLYLLSIIITHEDVFTGIERRIKHPGLRRYARWKALIHFHVNKTDLNRWRGLLFFQPIRSKIDVNRSIELIKEIKLKEKFPARVEFEKGWSPYAAISFLQEIGLHTGFYQPTSANDDWMASCRYLDVDDSIPPSSIAYQVEGNADVANKLILSLIVYDRKQDGLGIAKFLEAVEILCRKALNHSVPHQIEDSVISGDDFQMDMSNRKVRLERRAWENDKAGYHLSFTIDTSGKKISE